MKKQTNKQTNLSQHDKDTIKVLSQLLRGQKSTLVDGEGHKYRSYCKNFDSFLDITVVLKDEKVIARVFYNTDTREEINMVEAEN